MASPNIRRDFTGLTLGSLTVTSFANKRGSSGSIWNAECICGNKREISSKDLRRGINRQYNLSCGKCENSERRVHVHVNECAFNNLYSLCKSAATGRRNLVFDLTPKRFKEITKQNCHYCNCPPSQIAYNSTRAGQYVYNGIDRLDPSLGYVEGNCVPACATCNLMKQSLNYEDFIERVLTIARNYIDIKAKACPSFDVVKWCKEIGVPERNINT